MSKYFKYLDEIQDRAAHQGLNPKPIDDGKLLCTIIKQIMNESYPERDLSINFYLQCLSVLLMQLLLKLNF